MASFFRRIAESMGATAGTGSWARRIVTYICATGQPGQSWAEKLARVWGTSRSFGSWEARMKPLAGDQFNIVTIDGETVTIDGQPVIIS